MEGFLEILKDWYFEEYFVMGQNITTMSATLCGDFLLARDAEKFKNLPYCKNDRVGSLFVPSSYVPSTQAKILNQVHSSYVTKVVFR